MSETPIRISSAIQRLVPEFAKPSEQPQLQHAFEAWCDAVGYTPELGNAALNGMPSLAAYYLLKLYL